MKLKCENNPSFLQWRMHVSLAYQQSAWLPLELIPRIGHTTDTIRSDN